MLRLFSWLFLPPTFKNFRPTDAFRKSCIATFALFFLLCYMYLCVLRYVYFWLNHLKVSCRLYSTSPLNIWVYILKEEWRNCYTIITIRKLAKVLLIFSPNLHFPNWPKNICCSLFPLIQHVNSDSIWLLCLF